MTENLENINGRLKFAVHTGRQNCSFYRRVVSILKIQIEEGRASDRIEALGLLNTISARCTSAINEISELTEYIEECYSIGELKELDEYTVELGGMVVLGLKSLITDISGIISVNFKPIIFEGE